MGWLKSTVKVLGDVTAIAAKGTAAAVKGTGTALHGTAKFVSKHQDQISSVASAAVRGAGKVVQGTGHVVATGAHVVGRGLHDAGRASNSTAGKALGHAVGYAADALTVAGVATRELGKATAKLAPAVGGTAGGGVAGVLNTVSGVVDSVAITDAQFEEARRQLGQLGQRARMRSDRRLAALQAAQRDRRRKDLLDLLVIGGTTLSDILRHPEQTPPEVERAFALQYPGLAASETFSEAVRRMPTDDLVGIVNGVKGKLFEIELVEHLNSGNLPDGLHAELAASTTQPGYDLRIVDDTGRTVDVLQAKATESAAYVRDALERYPDIDVSTTTEVHAQLLAMGTAERVADSGISEAALQQKVEAAAGAAGDGFEASDLVPSTLGLAVIAMSSFMDKTLSLEQRGAEFGERAAKAGLSGAAGKLAMVATQTWWIALIAGVSSGWLASKGRGKRERYEALRSAIQVLEERETRLMQPAVSKARMLRLEHTTPTRGR